VRASAGEFYAAADDHLPRYLGIDVSTREGSAEGSLEIRPHHLAPNGYLHAGTVASLADTVCGFGCMASLPEGATGFTTIELKVNYVATALEGELRCRAEVVHGGRTTQVWDAVVEDGAGKQLALFRCTQLLLYASP
jgi:1,4-dihydroxy-2-naphthoyl-CoA hydrolase